MRPAPAAVLPTGVHVDTLKLIGSASHGTANNDGDMLWSNATVASTLNGGTGNDTFIVRAAAGAMINAGTGTDTIDFLASSIGNANVISGFDTSKDVVVFNHALFANYAPCWRRNRNPAPTPSSPTIRTTW
jgi:Ca2+-binding RTX toxin-like protein